jgi:hypothetical protein
MADRLSSGTGPTPSNWDGNFLSPVAGDTLVIPAGAARTLNTNNYPAKTGFTAIDMPQAYQPILAGLSAFCSQ